eukprot:CAMPEP_0171298096 /NCGR_PEP_ID=MMETSP0816-20121228/6878_1 /TAXON_ID=420281 /ORGANISM="Proboscia inermis, Strain CCAP1064/1" /LENGTH=75 /DNA_ID=CAMNT_0011772909 /DNA_START=256 /DNA_END=480 /DNA_ORIENTATION=+
MTYTMQITPRLVSNQPSITLALRMSLIASPSLTSLSREDNGDIGGGSSRQNRYNNSPISILDLALVHNTSSSGSK